MAFKQNETKRKKVFQDTIFNGKFGKTTATYSRFTSVFENNH